MDRQYRGLKMLLYTPGIISLWVIIPLCLFWMNEHRIFEKDRMLYVHYYDPSDNLAYAKPFVPARNCIRFDITGHNKDTSTLDSVRAIITEIVAVCDTTMGVRVHFSGNSKYESFVAVLDICERAKVTGRVPNKDDVWMFHTNQKPVPPFSIRLCGNIFLSRENQNIAVKSWKPVQFWPSVILFLLLFVLSVRRSLRV